jgi:hypothetical protein
MRRAAKVDANQETIVSALRAAGASVQSLAPIGKGCPDILIGYHGQNYLMEIKRGSGKTNDKQNRWHEEWKATVHIVYGPEEALKTIGAIR